MLPLLIALAAAAGGACAPPALAQMPAGASVRAGDVSFSAAAANRTVVTQTSAKAVIDWRTFSVGVGNSVQFVQPSASAIVLNRVTGTQQSQIQGSLTGNGQLWLLNPNGVLIGAGGQISSAGFLGTTHALADSDFLAGKYRFAETTVPGAAVVNRGSITAASGGYAMLAGEQVRNEGLIQAHLGSVVLGGAKSYVMDIVGDKLLSFQITSAAEIAPPASRAVVDNSGKLIADGGRVLISARAAKSVIDSTINTTGLVQANSVRLVNGVVTLDAGEAGTLTNTGRISANSTEGAGGAIHLTAANIVNSGALSADGASAGGAIRLSAKQRIEHAGVISADATASGAGGSVLLIADTANQFSRLSFSGSLSARGGPQGGDGGFVETSAAQVHAADSARVSTTAPRGNAGNWLIDPNDYTIAASGGNIMGAVLGANLGSGNVTISTATQGTSGGNGDIFVNDPVSWSTGNTLTLSAGRNIAINQSITASGTSGKLALQYGQLAVASGNTASYSVNAPVNLKAGANFSTKSGSDGATESYTVITALGSAGSTTATNLQGINGNRSGDYALGANIVASGTASWGGGVGFQPIGAGVSTTFSGTFDGLGHTISGLTINRPDTNYVGLFGYVGGGTLRNVGLVGVNLSGATFVGGLAGSLTAGSITKSYVTGSVTGSGNYVGGLAGESWQSTVSNSYATSSVSGGRGVGGLIGLSYRDAISGNYATGLVSGSNRVGGLLGENAYSTIGANYATGNVSGTGEYVGGLIGSNVGTGQSFSGSYASGNVSGSNRVGGLLGYNEGYSVSTSYAIGNVSGSGDTVGGLVGLNLGTSAVLDRTYATGSVTSGSHSAGGLVGDNYQGHVSDSYATGSVYSNSGTTGGLAGYNTGAITRSYATGRVSSASALGLGGLLGGNSSLGGVNSGVVTNRYWDIDTTGQATSAGSGATGIRSSSASVNAYTQATYSGFDFTNHWWMSEGYSRPLLRSEYSTTIRNAHQLQMVGMNSTTLAASYTLTNDLNLTAELAASNGTYPGIWGSAGFVPIGSNSSLSSATRFTGTFDGLGHTITGLTINRPTNWVGLFGYSVGTVRNVGLLGGSVTGVSSVGALVGENKTTGSISNSYATTSATGTGSGYYTGGLVGYNGAAISGSYATGSVSHTGTGWYTGGLVGANGDGLSSITDSYATGAVIGSSSGYYTGGLAGQNAGSISASYATGSVSGAIYAGGLVGLNPGNVSASYATGSVGGTGLYVGGLIGSNTGGISASYATGSVGSSASYVGGLVGVNTSSISESYATGSASGSVYVGGLVGFNASGTISDSYAIGSATGSSSVGGLVGSNFNGNISTSYATGWVTATSSAGGLIGYSSGGTVANNYWDIDTTGKSTSAGSGATGIRSSSGPVNVYTQATYSGFDFSTHWWMSEGGTRPLLRSEYSRTIRNAHQLQILMSDGLSGGSYTLGNDINLAPELTAVNGRYPGIWGSTGFAPIGSSSNRFDGTFDGLGRSISGLRIDRSSGNVGLFGYVDSGGTVRNVMLTNGSVAGTSYVGGLVGTNNGAVSSSYANVSVSGTQYVGGLVGYNTGSVGASYAAGGVVSSSQFVGGLVGSNSCTITDSYATGWVTGVLATGGLVGYSSGSVSTSYWDIDTTGKSTSAGGTGIRSSPVSAYTQATYSGFDFTNDWWMADGRTRPLLRSEYSTTIRNARQLQLIGMSSASLAATYTLANDINLAADLAAVNSTYPGVWGSAGFAPIGTYAGTHFTGTLDGQGRTISGLKINLAGNYNIGLFGVIGSGGSVRNLGLTGVDVRGDADVGGLAGDNYGSVSNTYTTGSVVGSSWYVGGLAGQNTGTISQSYSTSSVVGSPNVGGLVGKNSGTISASYASGNVSGGISLGGLVGENTGTISASYATGNASGSYQVGGLVGRMDSGTLSTSYATGTASGNVSHVGGLVGTLTNGSITTSYATGSIGASATAGGLVGLKSGGDITFSYATASVNAGSLAGGLVGYSSGGTLGSSYWNTETSRQATSAGGDGAAGKTTAQLKSAATYSGWSLAVAGGSVNTWRTYEGTTYPLLRSLLTPLTVTANNSTKTYDGLTTASGSGVSYSVSGTPSLSGSVVYTASNENVGSRTLNPSGLYSNQTGYDISYASGSLAVNPAPLTITAGSVSKLYGQTPTLSAFSSSGLQNAETIASVTLTSAGAAANAGVSASPYAITPSSATGGSFSAGNYAITYIDGALTISQRPITVTANDQSRAYGSANPSTGAVTLTSGSLANSDALSTASVSSTATSTTAAGQSAALTPSSQAFTTGTAGNYAITYVDGALTINRAPLTVAADDKTRLYGEANPALSTTVSGFVNGETAGTAAGYSGAGSATTTASATTNVGSATISASAGSLSATNYSFSNLSDGALTIYPAPLIVIAGSVSKLYGETPTLSGFGYAGLQNSETIGNVTLTSAGTVASAGVSASPYTITPSAATGGSFSTANYAISYVDGALTVLPQVVTVLPQVVTATVLAVVDAPVPVVATPVAVLPAAVDAPVPVVVAPVAVLPAVVDAPVPVVAAPSTPAAPASVPAPVAASASPSRGSPAPAVVVTGPSPQAAGKPLAAPAPVPVSVAPVAVAPITVVVPAPPSPVAVVKPPTPKDTADAGDKTLAMVAPPPTPKPADRQRRAVSAAVLTEMSSLVKSQQTQSSKPPVAVQLELRFSLTGPRSTW